MSKVKIAILGAGPAGLSTALFLTDPATQPDWADRYEVDIYQLGGASAARARPAATSTPARRAGAWHPCLRQYASTACA
jgi:glycine/D-amino acid oxidase-like deaminating enzyme